MRHRSSKLFWGAEGYRIRMSYIEKWEGKKRRKKDNNNKNKKDEEKLNDKKHHFIIFGQFVSVYKVRWPRSVCLTLSRRQLQK